MKNLFRSYLSILAFLLFTFSLANCSLSQRTSTPKKNNEASFPAVAPSLKLAKPWISSGAFPENENTKPWPLENGLEIIVSEISGKPYFLVEATFNNGYFNQLLYKSKLTSDSTSNSTLRKIVKNELSQIERQLGTLGAIFASENLEFGYFTFLLPLENSLFDKVDKLGLKGIVFNPVLFEKAHYKQFTPMSENLELKGRSDYEYFSGLERMGVSDFIKTVKGDLNQVDVDGSSVRLGVLDTGITYHHPTFYSQKTSGNRIVYMRDFTREGRTYFSDKAEFKAQKVEEGFLTVRAQSIITPKLPSIPFGDDLSELLELKIQVNSEQSEEILNPESAVRLGFIIEDAFQSDAEAVDINHNSKLNDKFPVLYFGKRKQILVDFSGLGDFRSSPWISDWNSSQTHLNIFSEKIGFDFQEDKLPKKSGKGTITVKSISIVGFDPGNHGSHVAGIAAGSRTIINDSPQSKARGVAPEAQILLSRVCANNGGCNATQALLDLAANGQANVVNMSLGGLSPFNDGYGVQEIMVNRVTQTKNVLVIISAGNSGPGRQTIGSPSVARLSLSVGATTTLKHLERQYQWPGKGRDSTVTPSEEDFLFFFSSRGPSAAGGFKPNITAPGSELSAIQLNAAPGMRSGLEVYWGTSMAAPAATGAFALLLDAINKYNEANPSSPLTTDVTKIRSIIIESARAFDVKSFNPALENFSEGQYTWIDQGTGMFNLPLAWLKLKQLRDFEKESQREAFNDTSLPSTDVSVLTSHFNPTGQPYDGSRIAGIAGPAFGSGLYLKFYDQETIEPVHISRRLPEGLAQHPNYAEWNRVLATSSETFSLKTIIFGSHQQWLKAGVIDQVDCWNSETADLTVIGRGAEILENDGKYSINPMPASTLNICINRQVVESLPAGDHGALVYAYKKVGASTSPVASFIVPISITVPHRNLSNGLGYRVDDEVKSFQVKRNYVYVPKGTTIVRFTLEVPEVKKDGACSGVELMALQGANTAKFFSSRAAARVSNCNAKGTPITDASKRKIEFSAANPTPGMWDIHVFGQYKYLQSQYTLKADFILAESSVKEIAGNISALSGDFSWKLKDSSFNVIPSLETSQFKFFGLYNQVSAKVKKGESEFVSNPLGLFRAYPTDVLSVEVTTGGSPGNDIDLAVLECPSSVNNPLSPECAPIGASGGSSDAEKVTFEPKKDKKYLVRVDGYEMKDEGKFNSVETLKFEPEFGAMNITTLSEGLFNVNYSFQSQESKLFQNTLFLDGNYNALGKLELKSSEKITLDSIEARITR